MAAWGGLWNGKHSPFPMELGTRIFRVVTGALAFLQGEVAISPTSAQLLELKSLLERLPVNQLAVKSWFRKVFAGTR